MKIVIFGANGPTGRILTTQALAKGYLVTAVTRHPADFPLRHERLRVHHGDVFDPASVDAAVVGQEAVLSTLGVPFSRQEISVYSVGAAHILQAMKQHGVRRFIGVTSSATAQRPHPEAGFIIDKIIQPLVLSFGRTLYDDMRRMEALVMESGLDWTIIRPAGLFETQRVTDYQVAEAHISGLYTSRDDLADVMLHQLTTDEYIRKVVAVVTVEEQPTMLDYFWRQTVSKGA